MALVSIVSLLTARLPQAVSAAGLGDSGVTVERLAPTANPAFGDYQSNHAMRIAKVVGQPPRVVAERIQRALEGEPALAKVEVAGPGFLK